MDNLIEMIGVARHKITWTPGPWEDAGLEPRFPDLGVCHHWYEHGVEMYVSDAPGHKVLRGVVLSKMENNGIGIWTGPLPLGLKPDMSMDSVEAKLGKPYDRFDNHRSGWPHPYLTYEMKLDVHVKVLFRDDRIAAVSVHQPFARDMLGSVRDAASLGVFTQMLFIEYWARIRVPKPDPVFAENVEDLLERTQKWTKKADAADKSPWRLTAEALLNGVFD